MEFEIVRLVIAFICGYLISVSGSLSQLITNNQLASPSTLGFDALAVLVILITQFSLTGNIFDLSLTLASTILFILCVGLLGIYIVYKSDSHKTIWDITSLKNVVLLGLSFNLFVGAIFSVVQFVFIAFNYEFPTGIWFGSLKQYGDFDVYIFIILFLITFLFIHIKKARFEVLNLGANFALGLGVNVRKIQSMCLLVSLFITGIIVTRYGVFSLLGLVFPHILRRAKFMNKSVSKELTVGAFLMGLFFVVLDLICFNFVIMGAEVPVGMISSVIGAVILIVLVLRPQENKV